MNQNRIFVSDKLIKAVKNNPKATFRIAVTDEVNMNPSVLCRIINRIETVRPNDPRILRLAKYLGLSPEDCFECEQLLKA